MGPAVLAVNNYGLDAELAAKANAKYDPQLEREAQNFIENEVGIRFSKGFAEMLRDGVVLCKLMNRLRPGSVRKIYEGDMPFKQMENISAFINAARRMGVAESDLFTTVALFEQKNIAQVVLCVLAIKRIAKGGSKGVSQGRSTSFQPTRNDASVSRLNNGSYGVMDTKSDSRVNESNRGKFASSSWRSNPNASVSRLNNGSYGTMESTTNRKPVSESNRAEYAKSYSRNGNGATRTVSMGPNSQRGVMRSMPWENNTLKRNGQYSYQRVSERINRSSSSPEMDEEDVESKRPYQSSAPTGSRRKSWRETFNLRKNSNTAPNRRESKSPWGLVKSMFKTTSRPGSVKNLKSSYEKKSNNNSNNGSSFFLPKKKRSPRHRNNKTRSMYDFSRPPQHDENLDQGQKHLNFFAKYR